MSFIVRSRPDAVVASVVTFWDRTGNSEHHMMVFKNFELLSEAQEVASLKERPSDLECFSWSTEAPSINADPAR